MRNVAKGFVVPANYKGTTVEAKAAFTAQKAKEAKKLDAEATAWLEANDPEYTYFEEFTPVVSPFKLETRVDAYGTTYNSTKEKATTYQKVAQLKKSTQYTPVVEDLEAEVLELEALELAKVSAAKKARAADAARATNKGKNPFTDPVDALDLLEWYETAEGKAVVAAHRATLARTKTKARVAKHRKGFKPVELKAVQPSPVEKYDLSKPTRWLVPNNRVWTPLKTAKVWFKTSGVKSELEEELANEWQQLKTKGVVA